MRAFIRIRTCADVREEAIAVARRRRRELLARRLVRGGGRGAARDADSDVVGEGTVVVDGSRKVIGDGRIAVRSKRARVIEDVGDNVGMSTVMDHVSAAADWDYEVAHVVVEK